MFKAFQFFLVLLLGVISCNSKKEEASKIQVHQVNEYPPLELAFKNGEQLSTKTLQGKNVFILFQPDCDHCQIEAVQVEQHLEEFKDYTLYFISSSPMDQIMAFAKNFKLDAKKNVRFAWTSSEGVLKYYGAIPTPSVYIYSNGVLKQSFNGQTEIESIVKAL